MPSPMPPDSVRVPLPPLRTIHSFFPSGHCLHTLASQALRRSAHPTGGNTSLSTSWGDEVVPWSPPNRAVCSFLRPKFALEECNHKDRPEDLTKPSTRNYDLTFILNREPQVVPHRAEREPPRQQLTATLQPPPLQGFIPLPSLHRRESYALNTNSSDTIRSSVVTTATDAAKPTDPISTFKTTRKTKSGTRERRICKHEHCKNYVVDHGLCIRHGGGKRCHMDNCSRRAQKFGLCWRHGGYTDCVVEGCTSRAKSKGKCLAHSDGSRCKREDCGTPAVSKGLCWVHGGGKRCVVEGCRKLGIQRHSNYCALHYRQHCDAEPIKSNTTTTM